MKILVTGAAGFIGFHLSKKLLSLRHEVIGIDNLNKAYDPSHKQKRLKKLKKFPLFTFYQVDILKPSLLRVIFKKYKISVVFHFAARTGVHPSLKYPKLYHTTNVTGTKYIYELANEFGIKQFIFASSSSVYGITQAPFSENIALTPPTSPYATSKQKAEKLLRELYKKYKIPTTVFRFFSVYGPYGRPDMAPYIFTQKIFANKTLTLYGDGNQSRDYTYIDDIIAGLTKALSQNHSFEIINLGNHEPVSINTLIHTIEIHTKKSAKINRKPIRNEEMLNTWADIKKAKELLGWKPKTSFSKGIQQFISWYQKEENNI